MSKVVFARWGFVTLREINPAELKVNEPLVR